MKDPAVTASAHGTPSKNASGLNNHPNNNSRVNSGMPNQPPAPPNTPFTTAINATNASNIAPTFNAKDNPDEAPLAAASMTLTGASSHLRQLRQRRFRFWHGILANNNPPGADIAAMRYSTGTPQGVACQRRACHRRQATDHHRKQLRLRHGLRITTRGPLFGPQKCWRTHGLRARSAQHLLKRTSDDPDDPLHDSNVIAIKKRKKMMIGNTFSANVKPMPSATKPPNKNPMPASPYEKVDSPLLSWRPTTAAPRTLSTNAPNQIEWQKPLQPCAKKWPGDSLKMHTPCPKSTPMPTMLINMMAS